VLLALASVGFATDILVPEATPESLGDFALAYMVYDIILNELSSSSYRVEGGDEIRRWAGKDADGCFDNDACPANLWDRTDARLALVLGIGLTDDGTSITARFYDAGHEEPIRVLNDVVPAGAELAFSRDLRVVVSEVYASLPARGTGGVTRKAPAGAEEEEPRLPPSVPVVADTDPDDLDEPAVPTEKGGKASRAPKAAPPEKDEEPKGRDAEIDDSPVTKERKPTRATAPPDEEEDDMPDFTGGRSSTSEEEEEETPADESERRLDDAELPDRKHFEKDLAQAQAGAKKLGVPLGAYERYEASGLSAKEWKAKARVRARTFFVEGAAGWAVGDTDRAYGVWADLEESEEGQFIISTDSTGAQVVSTWEGSGRGEGGGSGLAAWGAVGYAPTWWLEVSAAVGIQQGKKYLEAGWECTQCATPIEEVPFDPVTGTQLWIQPKFRFIPVPTGVLKPYALVGGDVALYDGFVPDTDVVDFPNAEGGTNWGVSLGAGLFVDAVPHLSFFAEVPFSLTLSPLWRSFDHPGVATQPAGIPGQGGVFRFTGGVSTHF